MRLVPRTFEAARDPVTPFLGYPLAISLPVLFGFERVSNQTRLD